MKPLIAPGLVSKGIRLALVTAYRNWRALQDTQDCDSAWCTG
jgi:hypothetical protein